MYQVTVQPNSPQQKSSYFMVNAISPKKAVRAYMNTCGSLSTWGKIYSVITPELAANYYKWALVNTHSGTILAELLI